jgi:hypothetical protein
MRNVIIFAGAVVVLSGCSNLERQIEYDRNINKFGAETTSHRDVAEEVDLVSVISQGERNCVVPSSLTDASRENAVAECGKKVDKELADFDKRVFGSVRVLSLSEARLARNSIQERLLMASNHRCGRYKSLLQEKYSNTNFATGVLATVLGTAGAISASGNHSRTLAGLAGAASGYRAEYNQAFYGNLLAHVVADGIDSRRRATYVQIIEKGQRLAYEEYPLSQAIKDAVTYHAQCNLITGLAEAGDAIRTVNDPGLLASTRAIAQVKLAGFIAKAEEPAEVQTAINNFTQATAGKWFAGVTTQAASMGTSATARDVHVSRYEQTIAAFLSAKTSVSEAAAKVTPALDATKWTAALSSFDAAFAPTGASTGTCTTEYTKRKKTMEDALAAQSIATADTRPAKLATARAADLEFEALVSRIESVVAPKSSEIRAINAALKELSVLTAKPAPAADDAKAIAAAKSAIQAQLDKFVFTAPSCN